IRNPVESHPIPTASRDLLPKPCLLYPERVIEYPDPFEFEEGLYERIEASESLMQAVDLIQPLAVAPWSVPEDPGELYQFWLSAADGTKVGGYPEWVQDPESPTCSCGARMDLLVMFASCEFDGITWGRWLPIQERDVLTADFELRKPVQSAMDVLFGDAGNLY